MSLRNWIMFVLLGLVWGSSFLWIKIAVSEVSPFTLVTFRVLFATLGVLGYFLLFKRAARQPAALRALPWRPFAIMGFFNVVLPFILISWAEQHIDSSLAAILNSTVPLFTILLAPFYLAEERITPARLGGLAVGFAGVVVLMWRGTGVLASSSLLGQAAMLLAAISYAASAVFARRAARGIPAEEMALGQMLAATLAMSVIGPLAAAPFTLPALPLTWLALVWLGLIGSCVGTLLYFALLAAIGPTRAVLTSYIFPLVGVLLGILFLGERPDWHFWIGGALILSGIIVVNSWQQLARLFSPRSAGPAQL